MLSRLFQVTFLALGLTISHHANAAPLAYGTYYDETASVLCGTATSCRINFSQLPADKLLMVEKINCTFVSSQPVAQELLAVSATSGGTALSRSVPMQAPPSQLINGSYFTSWQTDTHFLIGQSRFPFVLATPGVSATWGGSSCTMIGELVTPIQ